MITDIESARRIMVLQTALLRMLSMHEQMMKKINHGASFYDADCIREMNESPIQARAAITETLKD